jgi:hypothetical protein
LGNIENIAEKDRPERVIFDDTAHDVVDTSKRLGADVLLTTRAMSQFVCFFLYTRVCLIGYL